MRHVGIRFMDDCKLMITCLFGDVLMNRCDCEEDTTEREGREREKSVPCFRYVEEQHQDFA